MGDIFRLVKMIVPIVNAIPNKPAAPHYPIHSRKWWCATGSAKKPRFSNVSERSGAIRARTHTSPGSYAVFRDFRVIYVHPQSRSLRNGHVAALDRMQRRDDVAFQSVIGAIV